MPDEQNLDIQKVIEQSATRTTLSDLARKGIQRVKVLDERTIHELIRKAVETVVASRTSLLAEEERSKLFAESRAELDRLLREQREMRSRAELLETSKNELVQQVENLQRQLQLQRQLEEENTRKRYQEGTAAMQEQLREAQARWEAGQRELKTLRGEYNRLLTEQTALHQDVEGARDDAARLREALAHEQGNVRAAQAQAAQAQQIDAKLANLQQSLEQKLQAAQDSNLAAKLEALGSRDTEMAGKLERLFSRMTDSLSKKLGSLRGPAGEDAAYRPGELMLESLFKQELESNLAAIDSAVRTQEGTGDKMQDALAKLRAMRPPAGPEAPKDKS